MTTIPYTDVRVGDSVEINTVVVHSGKVVEISGADIFRIEGGDGCREWVSALPLEMPDYKSVMSARDRRVVLVNRPEPPKALAVGDKVSRDNEPPVGAKVARGGMIRGGVRVRERVADGTWKATVGEVGYTSPLSWADLAIDDFVIVHLPSE